MKDIKWHNRKTSEHHRVTTMATATVHTQPEQKNWNWIENVACDDKTLYA